MLLTKTKIQKILFGPDALALYFFIAVSYLIMWPLSGYLGTSTVSEGDSLTQMWSMKWVINSLFNDPANLFNANLFYPYPNTLAYSDAMIAQAFQAMPIMLFTGNIVLSYNVLTWFSFALSGWTMYLLVKEVTGSRAGGLLAGMVFAFVPYRIGRISQLNLLSTQWLPLCFLFLRRLFLQDISQREAFKLAIKRDWWLVAGFTFFFILSGLSSFYYLLYPIPLFAVFFVLMYALRLKLPTLALLLKLAVAAAITALVMYPVAAPYLQVAAEQAAERTRSEVTQFSANYRFYFAVTDNNLFWGNNLKSMGGTGGERRLFPGGLGLLFGAIGLAVPLALLLLRRVRKPKEKIEAPPTSRERWVWLGVGGFALLMSFGLTLKVKGVELPMPYAFFYEYVPGWKGLRTAVRYGLFVNMAVAVLAGFGVAFIGSLVKVSMQQRKALSGNRALRFAVPSVLVGVLLFGAFWEYHSEITYINPNILSKPPQVYNWLAEAGNAGPIIELPMPTDTRNGPSTRDYFSTFNLQPLSGGINAYVPPVFADLQALTTAFPSKESLSLLQGMGIRWIVYHLNDENTPLPAAEWQKIEARLSTTKEVKLVKDFPQDSIKVYELAPDPWMIKLVQSIPKGSDIIASDYRRNQPTAMELIETLFRRNGSNLYGNDRAGYRFLNPPPTGKAVSYGLFSADEDPSPYGFKPEDESWSGSGMKFYSRKAAPAAAYDVLRDEKLRDFAALRGDLELEVGKNEVKFNGKGLGSGKDLSADKAFVSLTLGSLVSQKIKVSVPGRADTNLDLPAGLSNWSSAGLASGTKLTLAPAAGQTLYLSRVELLPAAPDTAEKLTTAGNSPAIMSSSTRRDGDKFVTGFDILTPAISAQTPGKYTFTLDVYRRPWGTHPSGHFGNWSIALPGGTAAHRVEFSFDPVSRETQVMLDGNRADMGSEVIRPGEGDWAVFIALWRNNPQNPKADTQVGVSRLYEFSLVENKVKDVNLLPARPLFFLPPLGSGAGG